MRKELLFTLIWISLVGCEAQVIRPSFEYASTSLGVYNSGLLSVGQLFVLDLRENSLTRLDEVPFPAAPTSKTLPTTLLASNISSISFSARVLIAR